MLPDCRKAAARAVALALALAAPAAGQSTSSAAASAAAATASTSLAVTSAAVTIPTSGLLGGSATVTATALLRTSSAAELALKCSAVPTYSTISYKCVCPRLRRLKLTHSARRWQTSSSSTCVRPRLDVAHSQAQRASHTTSLPRPRRFEAAFARSRSATAPSPDVPMAARL